jgi:DNA-binding PadR family transcriptional regulator
MSAPIRQSRDVVALTVLALLAEQPLHAYGIQTLIRERHKDFAEGKTRALYHAVERLSQAGLIEPIETSREGRRPERTVYQITDPGREELAEWLSYLLATPLYDPMLLQAAVSFLPILSPEQANRALAARAVALECNAVALESVDQTLRTRFGLTRPMLLEHEYQLALLRAEMDWVRGLSDDIQSGRFTWTPGAVFKALPAPTDSTTLGPEPSSPPTEDEGAATA